MPTTRRSNDLRKLVTIWVILSAILDPVYFWVIGPHMPPGNMTDSAAGQQYDTNILVVTALPVVLAVWTYMAYAIINWRASKVPASEPVFVPDPKRATRIQVGWILFTAVTVMWAFGFGVYELVVPAGAGGGEGPNPIWTPASKNVLPIQVIGQQWMWTYRYPSFGGFETTQLVIPNDTEIAFHVTSLDVIHDFWAYQLGVKADANPQSDNVAFTHTSQTGRFTVRCDELCGIWHGAMYNYGHVVSKSAFYSWATSTQQKLAKVTKLLPPFSWTYTPDANGADGGYYPDNVDPYAKQAEYGQDRVVVTQYGSKKTL